MEEVLLEIINRIAENKRLSCVSPTYSQRIELDREVLKEVSKGLNQLYADGKIKVGNTLNDKWIELV